MQPAGCPERRDPRGSLACSGVHSEDSVRRTVPGTSDLARVAGLVRLPSRPLGIRGATSGS